MNPSSYLNWNYQPMFPMWTSTPPLCHPLSPSMPTTPLFHPLSPSMPTTPLFHPLSPSMPTTPLFHPLSPSMPTTPLFHPLSPSMPTTPLFHPLSPSMPTTPLFHPLSSSHYNVIQSPSFVTYCPQPSSRSIQYLQNTTTRGADQQVCSNLRQPPVGTSCTQPSQHAPCTCCNTSLEREREVDVVSNAAAECNILEALEYRCYDMSDISVKNSRDKMMSTCSQHVSEKTRTTVSATNTIQVPFDVTTFTDNHNRTWVQKTPGQTKSGKEKRGKRKVKSSKVKPVVSKGETLKTSVDTNLALPSQETSSAIKQRSTIAVPLAGRVADVTPALTIVSYMNTESNVATCEAAKVKKTEDCRQHKRERDIMQPSWLERLRKAPLQPTSSVTCNNKATAARRKEHARQTLSEYNTSELDSEKQEDFSSEIKPGFEAKSFIKHQSTDCGFYKETSSVKKKPQATLKVPKKGKYSSLTKNADFFKNLTRNSCACDLLNNEALNSADSVLVCNPGTKQKTFKRNARQNAQTKYQTFYEIQNKVLPPKGYIGSSNISFDVFERIDANTQYDKAPETKLQITPCQSWLSLRRGNNTKVESESPCHSLSSLNNSCLIDYSKMKRVRVRTLQPRLKDTLPALPWQPRLKDTLPALPWQPRLKDTTLPALPWQPRLKDTTLPALPWQRRPLKTTANKFKAMFRIRRGSIAANKQTNTQLSTKRASSSQHSLFATN